MPESYAYLIPSNENHDKLGRQAFKSGGGGGTYDEMEARVKSLEDAMIEIKVMLARLDERTKTLASKDDISALGKDISGLKGEMKYVLGVWQFLGVVAVLIGLILKWPELFRLAGVAP